LAGAPEGRPENIVHQDSIRLLLQSVTRNGPLLIYLAAFVCIGIAVGMWSNLLYFYLDGYLGLGEKVAMMLLVASIVGSLSVPICLNAIKRTSKATVWAIGVGCLFAQSIGMLLVDRVSSWWIPFGCVVLANLCFCCHEVAALSLLGDIVDYGRLKLHRDRAATYFGFNTLMFKIGLGLGGGVALGVAGLFGFDPMASTHAEGSIVGLKLGFAVLPACFAVVAFLFILRTPITRRRHGIIQRRLESRLRRQSCRTTSQSLPTPLSVAAVAEDVG
jgi:GPH family glycoside/pentoside/hexuronide:cation symporter